MANKKLREVPQGKKGKGLKKLPKSVRNKMGFMSYGGETRGDIQDRTKKKIQI